MPDAAAFQQDFGRALASHDVPACPVLARALTIHRNTASKAAQDALADNYPVVRAMVGEDAFAAVAFDYVEAAPPSDPRLCFYGEGFGVYLADYPPFADHLYLADVASVEWLAIRALFARDAEVRGPDSFVTIDLEAPLALHPAVGTLSLASPAGSLWRAHQADAPDEALAAVEWQPEGVLVTRPGNQVEVSVEPPAVIAFIEGCANGLPLSHVAGAAGDELSVVFARTISAGCFA
ncbi:MAG: DNA-binding domain-containing protein [Sphingomonas bacterium]|nr:DNA-binding domain-containing protein [Sphingomonas bacterium]